MWIAVKEGKPRYHHGNRQPSSRVTSPFSPRGERPLREGAGESWKGAPLAAVGAGGAALIRWPALFFCSGLGGRARAGPRPLPAFRPRNRCVFLNPSPWGRERAGVHGGNGPALGAAGPILAEARGFP